MGRGRARMPRSLPGKCHAGLMGLSSGKLFGFSSREGNNAASKHTREPARSESKEMGKTPRILLGIHGKPLTLADPRQSAARTNMKSTLLYPALAVGLFLSPVRLPAEGEPKPAVEAPAVSPEYKALIEKLFEICDTAEQYDTALVQGFDAAMEAQAEQMPAEMKAKVAKGMQKVKDLMIAEMGWKKVKDQMIAVYAEVFSAEEIQGIIKALDTPQARDYFKKMAKLQPKMATFAQSKTQELTPKIMEIMQEAMGEGEGEP